MTSDHKTDAELARLRSEISKLKRENAALRRQLPELKAPEDLANQQQIAAITHTSDVQQKIQLFRSLFRGREDVYPVRWKNRQGRAGYSPACGNEWHKKLCGKPKVKCGACKNSQFLPVSDQAIHDHLIGKHTIGVYPILSDGCCWFLAIDFDKTTWQDDVLAFHDSCGHFGIPAYLERSRSGDGAHVWIFFSNAISAASARKLGTLILTRTTDHRPGIGLESYDRFFPAQDTVPKGGFGNLIALPLQKLPREQGNSEFLDEELKPVPDQWAHLAGITRVTRGQVEKLIKDRDRGDNLLGVQRVSTLDEPLEDPWTLPSASSHPESRIAGEMPASAKAILSNSLYIEKDELPPALQNRLFRLAAFQNPEFYRAQAMRMSTFGKPRLISCADDLPRHIALPRGCRGPAVSLLEAQGIITVVEDKRFDGTPIEVQFQGQLRPDQDSAAAALLENATGILCAPTAFGKTVVATAIIAQRKRNTLILVHRRLLMDQWRERLAAFLDLPIQRIGQIGAGRKEQTKEIDVAVIQSLNRNGEVNNLVRDYGQVIVDEAHHVSAFSFEAVLKSVQAKYILGLTATPVRKDGHHPIILMQCGPIRHRVSMRQQREVTKLDYRLIPRFTDFSNPDEEEETGIQALYGKLAESEQRNAQILDDILQALEAGRSPLVLTERVGHLELLADRLGPFTRHVIVLRGGRSRNKNAEALEQLASIPDVEERLIIATGRYIGEGFDDPRLDTLFLTMPISWKGTLQQYVGRLHRQYQGKNEVRVYDYVDQKVAVLRRMYERRLKGYKAIGYDVMSDDQCL